EVARRAVLREEAPLETGRKPGAAAAAEVRLLERVDDRVRRQRQEVLQLGVAAALLVGLDRLRIRLEDVPEDDHLARALGPVERAIPELATEDVVDVLGPGVLDPLAVHLHRRRTAARGQALDVIDDPLAI